MRRSPEGFTHTPDIRAIMDRYEGLDSLDPDDIVCFENLSADAAVRLLELLPDWHAQLRQNFSPTFEEFVRLGVRFPGTVYEGYRVSPEREDERISIVGIYIPEAHLGTAPVDDELELLKPDLLERSINGTPCLYAWWD